MKEDDLVTLSHPLGASGVAQKYRYISKGTFRRFNRLKQDNKFTKIYVQHH